MISTRKEACKDLGMIYCDNCGYCNQKAKYDYEMMSRLHLWSKRGIGSRFKF